MRNITQNDDEDPMATPRVGSPDMTASRDAAPSSSSSSSLATSSFATRPFLTSYNSATLMSTSEGEPFSADDDQGTETEHEHEQSTQHTHKRTSSANGGFVNPAASSAARSRARSGPTATSGNTRIQPMEMEMDQTVAWAYRPTVLACLGAAVAAVVLFGYHSENLTLPPRVKRQSGLITAVVGL